MRRQKKNIKNNNNPTQCHLLPQHAKVNLICMKMRQSRTTASTTTITTSWSHIFNIKHFLIPPPSSPFRQTWSRGGFSTQQWRLSYRVKCGPLAPCNLFLGKKYREKNKTTYTHTRIASTRQPIHDWLAEILRLTMRNLFLLDFYLFPRVVCRFSLFLHEKERAKRMRQRTDEKNDIS